MAENVDWDVHELDSGFPRLEKAITEATSRALFQIGTELLRLSTFEVPHDTGMLQASGMVEVSSPDEVLVGYNKVYAAYQHEGDWPDGSHVIKHYQKGRKGHYLTDPLAQNLGTFESYLEAGIDGALQ